MMGCSRRQGRNEGGQEGHNSPIAEPLRGRRITAGAPKSPKNGTSTSFSTVNLIKKELRFEHGGAKLASSSGRHLTSLPPCS